MQVVFLEKRGDAIDIEAIARERGFDARPCRIDNVRLGHLEFHEFLELIGVRRKARLEAGVFAQSNYRSRPAVGGDLIVEQDAKPLEYIGARVVIGHEMVFGIVVAAQSKLGAVNHDFEVLLDVFVLLLGEGGLELRERGAILVVFGDVVFVGCDGDLFVVQLETVAGGGLRGVLFFDFDQEAGVVVALRNPSLLVVRAARRSRRRFACKRWRDCQIKRGCRHRQNQRHA